MCADPYYVDFSEDQPVGSHPRGSHVRGWGFRFCETVGKNAGGGYPPSQQQQQQATFKRGGVPPLATFGKRLRGASFQRPVSGSRRPKSPEVAQSRPKSPKVARSRPKSPKVARSRPKSPEVAQSRPCVHLDDLLDVLNLLDELHLVNFKDHRQDMPARRAETSKNVSQLFRQLFRQLFYLCQLFRQLFRHLF